MNTATMNEKSLSFFGRFWQRFQQQRLALVAALFLFLLIIVAIFRDAIMPYGFSEADFNQIAVGPNGDHWLGTDGQGRDLFSRVVYGTRISMQASLIAVAVGALIGLPLGLLAGYLGGRFERIVMWFVDLLFSLPNIIIAMGIIAVIGAGLVNAMIAVGIGMSTRYARLSRGIVLAEREELYVDGARVGGLSTFTIIFKHILPNIMPPLIVQTSLLFGSALLVEAALSFLGLGVDVSQPSWGRMLAEARGDLLISPWTLMPPATALALTVLAWNLFGDGLRDSLGRDISNNQLTVVNKKVQTEWHDAGSHIGSNVAENAALMLSNVEVKFPSPRGEDVTILNRISYAVLPGKTLGIVGESGSGKSMSVMAAMGIVPSPGQITAGRIYLNGQELTNLPDQEMRRLRGNEIAMIFQEPIASLNPTATVGEQLIKPMRIHLGLSKEAAWEKATDLLRLVRVPDPERRMNEYPHQFSGGMAQRVGIARALSCNPSVLVADEPTTALDVTVQGQVIDLLKDLQEELNLAIVFITHDLGVIAEVADRVAVMYAGEVVETGDLQDVFASPQHPYTQALLETLPHHGRSDGRLPVIEGLVPPPTAWPPGCRFNPRCRFATEICRSGEMELKLTSVGHRHFSACKRIEQIDFSRVEETVA
ncbi:MAG: dipeptide/oligopeptide/nickel ABC transporter permease/ATP-binding protein [Chloroflexota bacterium]